MNLLLSLKESGCGGVKKRAKREERKAARVGDYPTAKLRCFGCLGSSKEAGMSTKISSFYYFTLYIQAAEGNKKKKAHVL